VIQRRAGCRSVPTALCPVAVLGVVALCAGPAHGAPRYFPLRSLYSETQASAPAPLGGPPQQRAGILSLAAERDAAVVAVGALRSAGQQPLVWRIACREASVMGINVPPGLACLRYATSAGGSVLLGGPGGISRVGEAEIERLDRFAGVLQGSLMYPGPATVREVCMGLAADVEANVWSAGCTAFRRADAAAGGIMFPGDTRRWLTEDFGGTFDRPYPRLLRWRAPFRAMAGDPARPGVWVYGEREDGKTDLVHVDPSMAGVEPDMNPPSVVPEGVGVPQIAGPIMAADVKGRVWLAGDTLGGARVHVFDGKAFADVTPPGKLLKGRRFTQLMTDPAGKLYASTDGVGVLVYDGNEWRGHAINEHLPTLEGTELKPVSCMTLDTEGNLWIGTDNNVICWRE